MKLKRFLSYFMRVEPTDPDHTTIRFSLPGGEPLHVQLVAFDVGSNTWAVELAPLATEPPPKEAAQ